MTRKLLVICTLAITLFLSGCAFSFDKTLLRDTANKLEDEVDWLDEKNEDLSKTRDIMEFYNTLTTETMDSIVVIRSDYYGTNKKYSNGVIVGSSGFYAYVLADYNAIKQSGSGKYTLIDSYAREYSASLYEVDEESGLAIFLCNWDYYGESVRVGEDSEVFAMVDSVGRINEATIMQNIKSSTIKYNDATYESYYLNNMNLNAGAVFINDNNKLMGMYSSKLNVIVSDEILIEIINF